ncbi:aromatic ring-hydroxylating oxygenase subunit alpha, partial [Xanthomonas hortorum]
MRSRMHPKYYLSQEIFEREQRKIFRRVWLFAGLKTLLRENNCFITRNIAGIPLVIQNFHGQIRAFENVCLHRSALIQTGAIGCRPLVCPYHAWSYDEQGRVKNIPDCDAIYRLDNSEKDNLKLREFSLRAIGNLLFVNLDPKPMP